MDRFVARANIQHLEQLLASTTDEGERRRLQRLLDEEREKLKAAEAHHAGTGKPGPGAT